MTADQAQRNRSGAWRCIDGKEWTLLGHVDEREPFPDMGSAHSEIDLAGYSWNTTLALNFVAPKKCRGGMNTLIIRNGNIRCDSPGVMLEISGYDLVELRDVTLEQTCTKKTKSFVVAPLSQAAVSFRSCSHTTLARVSIFRRALECALSTSIVECRSSVDNKNGASADRKGGVSVYGCAFSLEGAAIGDVIGLSVCGLRCVRVCGLGVTCPGTRAPTVCAVRSCSNCALDELRSSTNPIRMESDECASVRFEGECSRCVVFLRMQKGKDEAVFSGSDVQSSPRSKVILFPPPL